MKRESFLSGPHGVRPAGPEDRCFYCGAKALEEEHAAECVIRRRTIVVRATVEYVVDVPEHWTLDDIDFFYNRGTRCMNNFVDDIARHVHLDDGGDGTGPCLCPTQINWREGEGGWISGQALTSPFEAKIEYVREADAIDESWSRVRVAELPG